jgi:hypothetical protein
MGVSFIRRQMTQPSVNRISQVSYRVISTMIQFCKDFFDPKQRVYCRLNRVSLLGKVVRKEEIKDEEWWRKMM